MEKIGKIAQYINVAPNTDEEAYAVPEDKAVILSSIYICNVSGGAVLFSLAFTTGAAPNPIDYIYYQSPLAADTTLRIPAGITLHQGQSIYINDDTTSQLSYTFFGTIIDQPDFP